MKTLLIISVLIMSSLVADELSWVDEQVDAIKPSRHGINNSTIAKLQNPFIFLEKNRSQNYKSKKKKSSAAKANYTRSNRVSSSSSNSRVNANKPTNMGSSSSFKLSAIINSSALINDQWYKLGDRLKNYEIIKISKTSVTLQKNNRTTVLTTISSTNNLKFKQ